MTDTIKLGILAGQLMILENETAETAEENLWLEENKKMVRGQIKILENKMDRDIALRRENNRTVETSVIQCQDCRYGFNGDGSCEIKHLFPPNGFCSKAKPNMTR